MHLSSIHPSCLCFNILKLILILYDLFFQIINPLADNQPFLLSAIITNNDEAIIPLLHDSFKDLDNLKEFKAGKLSDAASSTVEISMLRNDKDEEEEETFDEVFRGMPSLSADEEEEDPVPVLSQKAKGKYTK